MTHFQIEDKKMVEEQVGYIQKQYGKIEAQSTIEEGFELTVKATNEEAEIDATTTARVGPIERKKPRRFKSSPTQRRHYLKTKGLYEEDHVVSAFIGHYGR